MSQDLEVRTFKTSLIDHMNKFPIGIETKRLVLVDILNETTKLADSALKDEINALKQASEESNSEKSPE